MGFIQEKAYWMATKYNVEKDEIIAMVFESLVVNLNNNQDRLEIKETFKGYLATSLIRKAQELSIKKNKTREKQSKYSIEIERVSSGEQEPKYDIKLLKEKQQIDEFLKVIEQSRMKFFGHGESFKNCIKQVFLDYSFEKQLLISRIILFEGELLMSREEIEKELNLKAHKVKNTKSAFTKDIRIKCKEKKQ